MTTLASLMVSLGLDTAKFHSGAVKAIAQVERLSQASEKLNGVAKGTSLALMAGQAVQLGAALAPAAGALLAMPAAMAAVKVSTLTAKVALAGMGDAMKAVADGDAKKLKEAMKELSPSAQSFVKASVSIKKDGLDPLQKAVQQRFFDGLTKPLREAATSVLPTVKSGMTEVSGALNSMAKEGLRVAATPMFKGELAKVFGNTSGVLNTLRDGIEPLVTIVLKLANAGAPLAKRMAEWAVSGAKAASTFLSSEQGAAKLAGIVQRAGDTLASLGRIVGDVAVGLGGLFKGATSDGGNLLGTIESLTQRFATWAQSAQGQQQIGNVFQLLAQTGAALGPVLSMLSGPLSTLASIITSLPAPVQDAVAKFLAFSVVAAAIGSKVGPAISGIRLLATGIGGIPGVVAKIGPAATAVGTFAAKLATAAVTAAASAGRMALSMATAAAGMAASAARMVASMAVTAARVVAGWVLMGAQALAQAARVAAAWLIAMGPIGLIIAAVVALVALIVANWDTIKEAIGAAWEWVKEKTSAVWNSIVGFLTGLWNGIKTTAAAVWEWIKSKIAAFVSGAIAIFQNFTLPGLIAKHWETIKTAAQIAWNWVVTQIRTAATNIVAGVQTLAQIPGKVAAWFADMAKQAIAKAQELLAWAKGFGAKILSGLGNLASLLLSAGRDLIMGLINGVKEMAGRAVDAVKGVVGDAVQSAKNLLGIASPSKVFRIIGEQTMTGWIEGVVSKTALAVSAVRGVLAHARDEAGRAVEGLAMTATKTTAKLPVEQKTEIKGATYGTSGVALEGGGGWSTPRSGAPSVVVNMPNAVIREEADVPKLGAQFGFEYTARA